MKKYKQIIIPETIVPASLLNANRNELKDFAKKYCSKYIQGKTVTKKNLNYLPEGLNHFSPR
jgi:hypothetical protein